MSTCQADGDENGWRNSSHKEGFRFQCLFGGGFFVSFEACVVTSAQASDSDEEKPPKAAPKAVKDSRDSPTEPGPSAAKATKSQVDASPSPSQVSHSASRSAPLSRSRSQSSQRSPSPSQSARSRSNTPRGARFGKPSSRSRSPSSGALSAGSVKASPKGAAKAATKAKSSTAEMVQRRQFNETHMVDLFPTSLKIDAPSELFASKLPLPFPFFFGVMH